jgi:hypothetical protein
VEPEGCQQDYQNKKVPHQIQSGGDSGTGHCQMHFYFLYYVMIVMRHKVDDHVEHHESYEAIRLMSTCSPIPWTPEERSSNSSASEAL